MAQLARFSTEGAASRERLSLWDATLWGPPASFRTRSRARDFDGDASFGAIGALRLLRVATSPHCFERDAEGGRAGLVQLIVQHKGTATVTQYGRRAELVPGCWTICDADRALTMTSDADGEQIIVFMPRERLGGGSGVAVHFACLFGDGGGTARLLPDYLVGLVDEIGRVDDGNCRDLADMAAQLVRLALIEARNATPSISMRETLRLRVKDHVRRNLRDPALSIERVAAAFGCTKRHLHKVFDQDEMTLSQFIWSQRLEACRDALRNPSLAGLSITEVSFMWGFNNSAHFSKAFKERFGCPPGHYRSTERAKDAAAGMPAHRLRPA